MTNPTLPFNGERLLQIARQVRVYALEEAALAILAGDEKSSRENDYMWDADDCAAEIRALKGTPAAAPANKHIDDDAVDAFAVAMKEKLEDARRKGRARWFECDPAELSRMLREHVEKGDPRDVANFCMFLWSLGRPITPAAAVADAQPVAWRHSATHNLYEQQSDVPLADGDESAQPLFLHAQPSSNPGPLAAVEQDAERYRMLLRHTSPRDLAEHMGLSRKSVPKTDDPAATVQSMIDAAIAASTAGKQEPT